MAQSVKSQLGGLGKSVAGQIAQQPLEILKDVGGQIAGSEVMGGQPVDPARGKPAQEGERKTAQPSALEKMRRSQLAAMEQEIKEIRERGAQREEQQKALDERKKEEEGMVEAKEKESAPVVETRAKRMFGLVTGRNKRRSETRLPKSA